MLRRPGLLFRTPTPRRRTLVPEPSLARRASQDRFFPTTRTGSPGRATGGLPFRADPLRVTGPGRVVSSPHLSSRFCEAFLCETREEADPLAAFVYAAFALSASALTIASVSHLYYVTTRSGRFLACRR